MGDKLNNGNIFLAQSFAPSATGAYPVSMECAKSALEIISPDQGDFPRLKDAIVTNTMDESVPGEVLTSTNKVHSPTTTVDLFEGPLDIARSTTVEIDKEGNISSIEAIVDYKVGPEGVNFNSFASLRYSDSGSDLDVTSSPPKTAASDHVAEGISKATVNAVDRLMRECRPPDLISFTKPSRSALRIG